MTSREALRVVAPMGLDTPLRRAADIALASALLAASLPVLAVTAVAIRLDSRGPVLYRAARIGRGGVEFRMLKFRSMSVDADRVGPGVSGFADPRVTRVGRVLRSTKLDELPQLVNVLAGTMTLIGPRAESPQYLAHYTADELRLLDVRPGMTGPGQIEFALRQAADLDGVDDADRFYVEHQLHDKLALDLAYLRDRGLRRDMRALADTVRLMRCALLRAGSTGTGSAEDVGESC